MIALKDKIKDSISASGVLIQKSLYREAAAELWKAVRSAIFYHLKKENISYSSTREALKECILEFKDKDLTDEIIFLEIIGTLSEWDEYYEITKEQIEDIRSISDNIIFQLTGIIINPKVENNCFFLFDEIKRHIEDTESAASTNYAAAIRFNKNYNRFLRWGFIVTLIGLTCLVKDFLCCSHYNVYSQLTVLLGALLTLWPLIKDYSGKSVNHRRFAEEYNNIAKHCKNWQTNFPNPGENITSAIDSVICLRERLITINNLSPATSEKDYKKGAKNIKEGSYKYAVNNSKQDNMEKKKNLIKEWGENTAYSAKGHFKSADLRKITITILLIVNLIFALLTLVDIGVSPVAIKIMGVVSLIATIYLLIFESQNGKNSIKEHMLIGEEYLSIHYELQYLFSKDLISESEIEEIRRKLNEIRKKDQPMISQIAKNCATRAIEKKGEMIMWWKE